MVGWAVWTLHHHWYFLPLVGGPLYLVTGVLLAGAGAAAVTTGCTGYAAALAPSSPLLATVTINLLSVCHKVLFCSVHSVGGGGVHC